MLGSLLRIAGDVIGTAVEVTASVATPFVELAGDAISAADDMIVAPTADAVGEVCDSIKDVVQ